MKKKLYGLSVGMIVLLAVSLACNASTIRNLIVTPTPTPTYTSTVTLTPTASPTPTFTNTPVPTATFTPKPTGTSKTDQPDGSVLFTDYDNGYTVEIPAGWTAMTLNKDDINELMESVVGSNPDLNNMLAAIKNMDPDTFRIFALDFRPEHLTGGSISNVGIAVQKNSLVTGMSLKNLVDLNAQSLPQLFPDLEILSSQVTTSASGIPLGVIEAKNTISTATGQKLTMYQHVTLIKFPEGLLQITLSTQLSLKDTLAAEFKGIIDTLKFLDD